jgi:hypothetical protein
MRNHTTAEHIRTGHIITTDYARAQGMALEVAYPITDTFTNPEGATMRRYRFSGWEVHPSGALGRWREAAFGVSDTSRVYVLDDRREGVGYTYQAL